MRESWKVVNIYKRISDGEPEVMMQCPACSYFDKFEAKELGGKQRCRFCKRTIPVKLSDTKSRTLS